MNGNNNFNLNPGYNDGGNGGETVIQQSTPTTYDSYYNHKPRKKPWGLYIAIVVIAIGVFLWLWFTGFFVPIDRESEYEKLVRNVCNAAVTYSNNKDKTLKDKQGKIVYVTVGELSDANLIAAELHNYLNNEIIPNNTDVRLEVLPNKQFQCHGFVEVGSDRVKPVITLKGDATIIVPRGGTAVDPGVTIIDDQDGDISDQISLPGNRSGTVDTSTPGTYLIYYRVTDRAGNLSDTVIRTYIVQ